MSNRRKPPEVTMDSIAGEPAQGYMRWHMAAIEYTARLAGVPVLSAQSCLVDRYWDGAPLETVTVADLFALLKGLQCSPEKQNPPSQGGFHQ
jgi:hypothetical protein